MNLTSTTSTVNKSAESLYNYIIDFNNFSNLLPQDKISNVSVREDTFQFEINGMAKLRLRIKEKTPFSKVVIASDSDKLSFNLVAVLDTVDANTTNCRIDFESDLNPMMKFMLEKPLQNLINMIADKMKDIPA